MTKILLMFMAVCEILKFVVRAVAGCFQPIKKEKASPKPMGRDWYGNCENCGILGGLHRLDGKRYCAMCYAQIKTERDFAKKAQSNATTVLQKGKTMNILKDFDAAVASAEDTPKGYCVGQRTYDSYMSNDVWADYLDGMSAEHRSQYGDGSGGELEEKNGRPPKMAAFASSSRMTYMLSKDIPGFVFEKQLPTVIGGIANLDGYLKTDKQYVFVETKCREPYSHKSPQTIKQNYKSLYAYLQDKMPEVFSCVVADIADTRDMKVTFFCCGKEVVHFDIKQMLCHLLGVANKMLTEGIYDTPVQFLYLLYNPTELNLPQNSKKEILRIYQDTCTAAENYDFIRVFGYIIDFLMQKKAYFVTQENVTKLKNGFRFALCDQNSYRSFLSKEYRKEDGYAL